MDITIRRLFPLTGRVDITDARSGARLGITSRLGVVRHPDGRVLGRFRDARTMRSYLGEGVLTIVLGIIFGGSDSDGGTSPTGLRWVVDGEDRGELRQSGWPFAPTREPIPRAERSWIQRLIPERVATVLRRIGEAPCWKLEHDALAPDDARLTLAAAVVSVELSRW